MLRSINHTNAIKLVHDGGLDIWPTASSCVVGVIGDPIKHSLSPLLHNAAFRELGIDWVSIAFRVKKSDALSALVGIRSMGIAGVSVTMPHKADVVPGLDRCSETAQALGAVNCVTNRDGELTGDSTDGIGFLKSLEHSAGFSPIGQKCMVIGAGGAGRAVALALSSGGASEVVIVNRTKNHGQDLIQLLGSNARLGEVDEASEMDLVVNTTPIGMAETQCFKIKPLVSSDLIRSGQVVADLVYFPQMTSWLQECSARGAITVGGIGMLVYQAAAQLEIWLEHEPPIDAMWEVLERKGIQP